MYKIVQANKEHLDDIAAIDMDIFHYQYYTQLGKNFVKKHYGYILSFNPESRVLLENDKVIGYLIGGVNIKLARLRFLKEQILFVSLKVMYAFLTSGVVRNYIFMRLKNYLKEITGRKSIKSNKTSDCKMGFIISFALLEPYRGKGLAELLIKEFENCLTKLGVSGYTLFALKENKRALAFYKKMGAIYEKTDNYTVLFSKKLI